MKLKLPVVAEIIDPNICKAKIHKNRLIYIEILKDFNVNWLGPSQIALAIFGVYNLGNHWELELHIFRLRAPWML